MLHWSSKPLHRRGKSMSSLPAPAGRQETWIKELEESWLVDPAAGERSHYHSVCCASNYLCFPRTRPEFLQGRSSTCSNKANDPANLQFIIKRRTAVNHQRLSFYMSYVSVINLIQGQLNPIYIFQFLNAREGRDYTQQFLYIWSHAFCPRAISHLPHSVISGGMSLQGSDRSPHGGPLRSFQGNLLFNLKTPSPHKCFPHCPLQSIKEILLLVSTMVGILLMLYELCPPICAFQCSRPWPLQERMLSSKRQKFNRV